MTIIERANNFLYSIAAIVLAVIATVVVVTVLLRIASVPLLGADEITQYLNTYLVFLAIAVIFRQRKHIQVDLVISHVPPKARYYMRLMSNVICVMFSLFVFWGGVALVINSYQAGSVSWFLFMPVWIWQICLPVGMMSFTLEGVCATVAMLKSPIHTSTH
jgi:TRAP-type C4-dicarboxylate transport system permease small subunit